MLNYLIQEHIMSPFSFNYLMCPLIKVSRFLHRKSPFCSIPESGEVKAKKETKLMASQPLPKSPEKYAGTPFILGDPCQHPSPGVVSIVD